MSVQTKEVPSALDSLLKAKGQNIHKDIAVVKQPAAVIVENQHTEVPVTSEQNPNPTEPPKEDKPVEPATTVTNPAEPQDQSRESTAWKELKAHHDKLVYELREKNRQLENSLAETSRPVIKAPKTPEEMKVFKEQYKEAYDFIETMILDRIQNSSMHTELQEKVNKVTAAQNELREKEAFKQLLEEHPDADEIRRDPKFAEWFNDQPDDIKRILATSTDVRAISKQLSLYKLEVLGINPKEKKKADAQNRVDASVGVDVKSHTEISPQKKIWTGTEIRNITSNYKLWNKHREELDAARKEDRVDWSK